MDRSSAAFALFVVLLEPAPRVSRDEHRDERQPQSLGKPSHPRGRIDDDRDRNTATR
jgi:hypothetical protein